MSGLMLVNSRHSGTSAISPPMTWFLAFVRLGLCYLDDFTAFQLRWRVVRSLCDSWAACGYRVVLLSDHYWRYVIARVSHYIRWLLKPAHLARSAEVVILNVHYYTVAALWRPDPPSASHHLQYTQVRLASQMTASVITERTRHWSARGAKTGRA